jgi:hypothetical protein
MEVQCSIKELIFFKLFYNLNSKHIFLNFKYLLVGHFGNILCNPNPIPIVFHLHFNLNTSTTKNVNNLEISNLCTILKLIPLNLIGSNFEPSNSLSF